MWSKSVEQVWYLLFVELLSTQMSKASQLRTTASPKNFFFSNLYPPRFTKYQSVLMLCVLSVLDAWTFMILGWKIRSLENILHQMEQRNVEIMQSVLDMRAAMADTCSKIDTLTLICDSLSQ